jgi:hypothetical protein
MRLYQDQLYRKGDHYLRITRLDRYEVEYKVTEGDPKGQGKLAVLPKKPFCRLLKDMVLVSPQQAPASKPED